MEGWWHCLWTGGATTFLMERNMSIFGPDFKTLNQFALHQTRFTPDVALLDLREFHLVFVCDDVMYAGKNYKAIAAHSARVSKAFTRFSYKCYQKVTDGTPALLKVASQPTSRYDFSALKIKGEIHSVTTDGVIS